MTTIGYLGDLHSGFAAFRLRVLGPAPYTGYPYVFGQPAHITMVYRRAPNTFHWLENFKRPFIFDMSNNLFSSSYDKQKEARLYVEKAQIITCCSEELKRYVTPHLGGKPCYVVPDCWESPEREFSIHDYNVLWFGHKLHLNTIQRMKRLIVCSEPVAKNIVPWSLETEQRLLESCGMVQITGNYTAGTPNRITKALRMGKFILLPKMGQRIAESWRPLLQYCWTGDPEEGRQWALKNPNQAKAMVEAGQNYVRYRFSPETIGQQWGEVFSKVKI